MKELSVSVRAEKKVIRYWNLKTVESKKFKETENQIQDYMRCV